MSDCSCSSAADSRKYCQVHGTGISKYTEYKFYDTLKGANPVENKQPSEPKVSWGSCVCTFKYVNGKIDEVAQCEYHRELISTLKSQADGLADVLNPVLDAIKLVQPNVFKEDDWNEDFMKEIVLTVKECRAIKSTLEAYRK